MCINFIDAFLSSVKDILGTNFYLFVCFVYFEEHFWAIMSFKNLNNLEGSSDENDEIDDFDLEIDGHLNGILDKAYGSENDIPIKEAPILN